MDFDAGICAVKFGAPWCGPCKTIEPIISKMKEEFSGVKFFTVDVEEAPQLAKTHRIRKLPTVILLRDGQEVRRLVGAVKTDPVRKAFRDLVKDQAA
jgi:thioredoxin 1